jgi:hypothetical protein
MSEFSEIQRDEIAVQFARVPDGLPNIRRAWDELEAAVDLHGRRFYGAFDPVANDYRACVEVRDADELAPASSPARRPAAAISVPACAATRPVSTSGSGRRSAS